MKMSFLAAAALAAALSTAPALAQEKGPARERGHGGTEQVRGGEQARAGRDRDEGPRFGRRNARPVPPGWCQGRGNPHRTSANCGYHTDRIERDREGVWRDRFGNRIEREGIYRDVEGILRDRYGRPLS